MPGLPITAMVAATQLANADVFPIVQSGANLKCTRPVFLSAIPGEAISMSAGGCNITIANDGAAEVLLPTNKAIKIWHGASDNHLIWSTGGDTEFKVKSGFNWNVITGLGNQFLIDNLGNVIMTGAAGAAIQIQIVNNSITMLDGGGIAFTSDAGIPVFIPYVDGSGGAWKVAPPADINTAIDRLAACFKNSFGTLVP